MELVSKNGKQSEIKLPVVNGLAKGCFPSDHTFEEGNYSIRAYTRPMRNQGDTLFFQRNILISSAFKPGVYCFLHRS